MKPIYFIILALLSSACGKSSGSGNAPFNGDGLSTATYTQQTGFTDVQICGGDVHQMPDGSIHVSGGGPISTISDASYIQASDGYFVFPNYSMGKCWFYITNGKFDTTKSTVAPSF